MAPIIHIALYTFKSNLPPSAIEESTKIMLSLKDRCLHPITKKPYIVSMVARPNLRPELGYAHGYTHVLVMEFANREDWLYYTKEEIRCNGIYTDE